MDIKSGKAYPAGALSNLTPHPFTFRSVECASMEGLLQSFKYKNVDMQREVCSYTGMYAKRYGAKKNWQQTQTLWWDGIPIERSSDQYQQILDEAYRAMFTQNEKAKKALLASKDANLKHSVGRKKANETVLTTNEFCSRLMMIRGELQCDGLFDY